MIPIHELLNRIRWDAEFARGSFQLGYYDRSENRVILVPFSEVSFPPDSRKCFSSRMRRGGRIAYPFIACGRCIRTRNAFGIGLTVMPTKAVSHHTRLALERASQSVVTSNCCEIRTCVAASCRPPNVKSQSRCPRHGGAHMRQ